MSQASIKPRAPTAKELEEMHDLYRKGGGDRLMAPHILYSDPVCPHAGCGLRMQAIDFRLESYGPAVRDPLVLVWWNDTGFAGRCPKCGGWIHFTIRQKKAISGREASQLPQLPDDWHSAALIL